MRRRLQGRQRASTRARRVVAATRSEKTPIMSAFNEEMRGQHVARQPTSACQERFRLSGEVQSVRVLLCNPVHDMLWRHHV
jgi:hypothetical protein